MQGIIDGWAAMTNDEGKASPSLNGIRVMLVDDDDDCLDLAAEVLRRAGAEVHEFSSAGSAFSSLARLDPDVIVSDIGMPIENGYSFMRRVRQCGWQRAMAVPALAVTAYVTAADRSEALDAGFNMHLSKPTPPSLLVGAVSSACRLTSTG